MNRTTEGLLAVVMVLDARLLVGTNALGCFGAQGMYVGTVWAQENILAGPTFTDEVPEE